MSEKFTAGPWVHVWRECANVSQMNEEIHRHRDFDPLVHKAAQWAHAEGFTREEEMIVLAYHALKQNRELTQQLLDFLLCSR